MKPKSGLMRQLKAKTEQEHHLTEEVSFGQSIRNGTLQLLEYKDLILKNYLIHQQLEQGILKALAQVDNSLLSRFFRQRSPALAKDMEVLNLSAKKLSPQVSSFSIEPSTAQVFGAMYVLEGSMLGNQYIAKALRQNEHLKSVDYFHFYQKDEETGKRWKAFQQMADDLSINDFEEAIEAAKNTFRYFRSVFELNLTSVRQDSI